MRKDLESFIRGATIQETEAAPVAAAEASGLWLLAAPAKEDMKEEVKEEVKEEIEERIEEEAEEELEEEIEEEIDEEAEEENEEPHTEDEFFVESAERDAVELEKPASEPLEEAGARLATRLSHLKESKQTTHFYQRSGLRESRARVLTVCLIAVIVVGTVMALYRNMQRTSYSAMMERGRELYDQEQFSDAFEVYSETSQRYPSRFEPFLGTAHSAERMGRVDDAITAYRSAIELFPAGAVHLKSNAFYEIGRLHVMLKAWDKAQESFESAIAADVANHRAYFSLGDSLEAQAQPDKALSAYKQALELSPSSDAAREAIRRVELAMASKEEAEKKAVMEQQYAQAMRSGGAALEGGRFREASDHFAAALAIRSDDANAWVGFAEARAKLGDSAGEARSLERALERDPEHQRAKKRLEEIRKNNARPRQNNQRRPPRSRRNTAPRTQEALARTVLFEAGVELYRNEEYMEAFNSFVACLRSPDRSSLPSAPLAGASGSTWKGFQVRLNIPPKI